MATKQKIDIFSTKDLENPLVTSTLFPHISTEELANDKPIIYLEHPYLINLYYGSLVDTATAMGDRYTRTFAFREGKDVFQDIKPKEKFKNEIKTLNSIYENFDDEKANGPFLNGLVRRILYTDNNGFRIFYNHYTYLQDRTHKRSISCKFHSGKYIDKKEGILHGPVKKAGIMIIGKCLGYEEEESGIPFIGRGSRPLWTAWQETGFKKISQTGSCYLTNFIKFKIGNDITICPQWAVDGVHLLFQELFLVQPKVVILLGNDVISAFMCHLEHIIRKELTKTKKYSVRSTTEPAYRLPERAGVGLENFKIFFLEHPASIARRLEAFPSYVNRLKIILNECAREGLIEKEKVQVTNPSSKTIYDVVPYEGNLDYRIIGNKEQLQQAILDTKEKSKKYNYIAVDTEWIGKIPVPVPVFKQEGEEIKVSFSLADGEYKRKDGFILSLQWSFAPGQAYVLIFRDFDFSNTNLKEICRMIREMFRECISEKVRIVGHFFKGDLRLLSGYEIDIDEMWKPIKLDVDKDEIIQQTKTTQFFDTYVASFCVNENTSHDLEKLAIYYLNKREYSIRPDANIAKKFRLVAEKNYVDITGTVFDDLDDKVSDFVPISKMIQVQRNMWFADKGQILQYCGHDVDYTGQLYLLFNGIPEQNIPGMLDGEGESIISVREIFARRMAAWCAAYQAEKQGMLCDIYRQGVYTRMVKDKYAQLQRQLAELTGYENFNYKSVHQLRYYLFGEQGIPLPASSEEWESSSTGRKRSSLPYLSQNIKTLSLTPIKSTSKFGELPWEEAIRKFGVGKVAPSVDRETIAMLRSKYPEIEGLKILYDLSCLEVVSRTWLRDEISAIETEGGNDRGILNQICSDGRIRTMFGLAETGRFTSSSPNMQNLSEQADENVERVLGLGQNAENTSPSAITRFRIRSIFKAGEGKFLVNADLVNAEVCSAAWISQDKNLLEHVRRAMLPEDHPEYLDMHSDLVQRAFKINEPYAVIKKKYKALRTAAKRIRFAHYYGGTVETIYRRLSVDPEISKQITFKDVEEIIATHDETYPKLKELFDQAKQRVLSPGWLRNCFGGIRRFPYATRVEEYQLRSMEREAINWVNQGLVADAIDTALGHLRRMLDEEKLESKIVLTVHDSIMLECPAKEVSYIVKTLLPEAMCRKTTIIPTDLSGRKIADKEYHFSIDINVYKNWGEPLPPEIIKNLGLNS